MPGAPARLSRWFLSEQVSWSSFVASKAEEGDSISGRCPLLAILIFPRLPGFGANWL